MIGIKLDGDTEFLELFPDASISIKLENPLFGDAEKLSPGSYSLPFDLPAGDKSGKNSQKIKHPDVIENNQAYQLQKASLFASGDVASSMVPFKFGNLKSKSISGDRVEANFTFGLNTISEDFKTAKLRDIMSEVITIPGANITKKIYVSRTGSGLSDPWDVVVNGQTYQGAHAGIVEGKITSDGLKTKNSGTMVPVMVITDTNEAYFYMGAYYDSVDWLGSPIVIITPSTDPSAVELNVAVPPEDPVWTIGADSVAIDNYFEAYEAFLEDYPDSKICFPVLFNAAPFSETVKRTELINATHEGLLYRNNPNNGECINSLQPFVYLKFVLDKIATHFNFEIDGDFYTNGQVSKMFVDNSYGLDYAQKFINDLWFIWWKKDFNISELVPDVTVVEFLKALQSRYNLGVYFSETTKKVRLCFRENIALSLQYEDITAISSPKDKADDLRKAGYIFRDNKDDTDAFSVAQSLGFGSGEIVVEPTCGRLCQETTFIIKSETFTGVRVSRQLRSAFKFRIFYDAGIVTNGSFDYRGSSTSGPEWSEDLSDPPSLFNKCWLYSLSFEKNRMVIKINVDYPLRKLLQYDWELKRRFNRVNYLVKSLDVVINNEQVKVTGAELYTQK